MRVLYGLKTNAFRALLAETLDDLNYKPTKADPDVYLRPAVKNNGFKYYEYVLIYDDEVLYMSDQPQITMKGIQHNFKIKNDKIEEPSMYLGAEISKMHNETNKECWAMSSDKYCAAAVANVSTNLEKKGLKLPTKCITPLSNGYRPELDVTAELKADGVQYYQELLEFLRWAVEIGRVDILLEVSMMSSQLALPRERNLEQVIHILLWRCLLSTSDAADDPLRLDLGGRATVQKLLLLAPHTLSSSLVSTVPSTHPSPPTRSLTSPSLLPSLVSPHKPHPTIT